MRALPLVLISIVLGLIIFYSAPLSSVILENFDFQGKVSRTTAEDTIATTGVTPLYSWYSLDGIQPVIIVMGEFEDRTGKSQVDAFSGEILESDIIDYAKNYKPTVTPNPRLDDVVYQKLVEIFPLFEYVSSDTKSENGTDLLVLDLWVNNHFAEVIFDATTEEVLKVQEEYWKTKGSLEAPQDTTPPVITLSYPNNTMVLSHLQKTINVQAEVVDDTDPSPEVRGTGEFVLQDGFNKIIVVAVDASGNASSAFVVVQRSAE